MGVREDVRGRGLFVTGVVTAGAVLALAWGYLVVGTALLVLAGVLLALLLRRR